MVCSIIYKNIRIWLGKNKVDREEIKRQPGMESMEALAFGFRLGTGCTGLRGPEPSIAGQAELSII